MIKTYRSKALRLFAEKGDASKLALPKMADKIARTLEALNVIKHPSEMNMPGIKYHALTGKLKGRHAVWISGNYRVTFGWEDGHVVDVDLEDYH